MTTEMKVGATVLVGIAIIVYMSVRVNDAPLFQDKGKTYYALFDDSTGILLKTPVFIYGIKVGYVSDIILTRSKAKLEISGIDPSVKIYQNAKASIRDKGILGERIIALTPGDDSTPELKDGGLIAHTSSLSQVDYLFAQVERLAELFPKFEAITANIEDVTQSLSDMLGQKTTTRSFEQSVRNVEKITVSMRRLINDLNKTLKISTNRLVTIGGNLERFTGDLTAITSKNIETVKTILDNVQSISESVRQAIDTKGDGTINQVLKNARDAAERLDETLASLQRTAEYIEKGEGTVGRLLHDDTLVNKLEGTVDGVNYFLDNVNRIQTVVGYRTEYLSDHEQFQNMVQLKIYPRPDKYFEFEIVDEPVGETNITDTQTIINGETTLETREKKTTDDFTFTALFAKRFYDLTFRFGVIRSEGGFGLDYSFFKRRMIFSFEAFDFSRDERPHLRSFVTVNFLNYFIVTGGVDDFINNQFDRPMDYFVGAGLSFTDEDVKTLVSSLPLASMF